LELHSLQTRESKQQGYEHMYLSAFTQQVKCTMTYGRHLTRFVVGSNISCGQYQETSEAFLLPSTLSHLPNSPKIWRLPKTTAPVLGLPAGKRSSTGVSHCLTIDLYILSSLHHDRPRRNAPSDLTSIGLSLYTLTFAYYDSSAVLLPFVGQQKSNNLLRKLHAQHQSKTSGHIFGYRDLLDLPDGSSA
jgi:hypothetical protein